MIFLQPLALLALFAAAVPALLHLLQRRDPPEIEFPAIRYLTEAERRSARRLKLRHLLLLVLRTALIIAIVLAAARPLVPATTGGTHQPTALVVVLDNSPSSGAIGANGEAVLDRLRAGARASLERATSVDRVWLMLADGVIRAGPAEELVGLLDSVTPGPQRLELSEAVERAARTVNAEPLLGREVHVLSDMQRSALDDATPGDVPAGVRVLALAPPVGMPVNRGIASAIVVDGALEISIAGTSGAPAARVSARLIPTGRRLGNTLVAPGGRASIELPEVRPGWWWGEVELEPDELRVDDRRPFVWRVAAPARVAVDPATGPFVLAAISVLREAGRVAEGSEMVIAERPGIGPSVVIPPVDPALVGQVNRTLAARGTSWRFGVIGTPGAAASTNLPQIDGIPVARRYRLERSRLEGDTGEGTDTGMTAVLGRVNQDPWLVRDGNVVLIGSRLDTAWTGLPAGPQFVPFLDALVNRVAREGGSPNPVRGTEGLSAVNFEIRGTDTIGATVSAPDSRESDLSPASESLIADLLRADVLRDAVFARAGFAGFTRTDITSVLLILGLALAAIELVVATRTR